MAVGVAEEVVGIQFGTAPGRAVAEAGEVASRLVLFPEADLFQDQPRVVATP